LGERKPPLILLGSRAGAGKSTSFDGSGLAWREPEWLASPALYDGVFFRRCVAYFLDALIAFLICSVLAFASCTLTVGTLGFLSLPAFIFGTPFVHFVLAAATIGGRRAATPGMRAMDLRAVAWNGENPGPLRAIIMTAMFYATVPTTGFLILVFGFFDPRGRLLHDHLAGVLVYRSEAAGRISAAPFGGPAL
jgi:uncharacterized RDD family membrane protein YckC